MTSTLLLQLPVLLALDVYPNHTASFRCRFDNENSILYVLPMSKIHIVCPNPTTIMKKVKANKSRGKLYQNLWIVSRDSYERCDTDYTPGSRLLLRCIYPLRLKYYTLVFQRYSALSSQVFIPGKEYYFIGMYVHFSLVLRCLNLTNESYFESLYFQYMSFFSALSNNFG